MFTSNKSRNNPMEEMVKKEKDISINRMKEIKT